MVPANGGMIPLIVPLVSFLIPGRIVAGGMRGVLIIEEMLVIFTTSGAGTVTKVGEIIFGFALAIVKADNFEIAKNKNSPQNAGQFLFIVKRQAFRYN